MPRRSGKLNGSRTQLLPRDNPDHHNTKCSGNYRQCVQEPVEGHAVSSRVQFAAASLPGMRQYRNGRGRSSFTFSKTLQKFAKKEASLRTLIAAKPFQGHRRSVKTERRKMIEMTSKCAVSFAGLHINSGEL